MSEAGFVGDAVNEAGQALLEKVRHALDHWPDDPGEPAFSGLALEVFRFQWKANPVYHRWCSVLGWAAEEVAHLSDWTRIPALPVEAFKWDAVRTEGVQEEGPGCLFRTSGTTGQVQGEHHVVTPGVYRSASARGFQDRFGPPGPGGAELLALLPGYLDRPDSSLVHMVRDLREAGWCAPGDSAEAGFFLDDLQGLFHAIDRAWEAGRKPVLLGVTWAMVDAAEAWRKAGRPSMGERVAVLETGGMKGRRKEEIREAVHARLKAGFGCTAIGGEYGMTELLSQAWSLAEGHYRTPPWMRVRLRRTDDPLTAQTSGATGGLDVIDLANLGSCAFLSTQDLARPKGGDPHREFEVLGRFDHAEVRGCNLMVD